MIRIYPNASLKFFKADEFQGLAQIVPVPSFMLWDIKKYHSPLPVPLLNLLAVQLGFCAYEGRQGIPLPLGGQQETTALRTDKTGLLQSA